MKSVTSSNQFRLRVKEMNPWRLREFLLVAIDRAYKKEAIFTHSLLQACIDSHNHIIDNLNLDLADNIPFLFNNMINMLELKEQNLSK